MDISKKLLKNEEIELREKRTDIEQGYNWFKWCDLIPYLSFGGDVEIQILPPVREALIKFRIRKKENPNKIISVLLNGENQILNLEEPAFWEIASLHSSGYDEIQYDFENVTDITAEINRRLS